MPHNPLSALPVQARLDAVRPRVCDLTDGPLEYVDTGEGDAVLSLHGAMGGHDQALLLAMAGLSDWAGRRILAPSRPGYLGTPLETAKTPEAQADLFAALLDRLDISAADVIAVSGGGPSAIHFAARHPQKCRSLILVSACSGTLTIPPEYQDRFEGMVKMTRLAPVRWIMAAMGRFAPERAIRQSILDADMRRRTLADPQAGPLIRALQRSTMTRLNKRMPGLLNDTANCAAIDALPIGVVKAPVLVIHGKADRVVPFAHAERVSQILPEAHLLEIPEGEHVALFTHLGDVRAATGRLLASR